MTQEEQTTRPTENYMKGVGRNEITAEYNKGITQFGRVSYEIQKECKNAPVQLRLPLSKEKVDRYIDTQKLICMRCGAWDAVNNRPDDVKCGLNCALLTKGKTQGFNCKLQRYQANLRARGLL